MRGAADGLNIVVPFGDKRYRELRPTLAISPADRARTTATALSARHRSGWDTSRLNRRIAAPESAVGQAAIGDCGGHWIARSLALALRCAGLHGIGHARQDEADGWLNRALPAAAAGRFAVARGGAGESGAAHAARRARGDRASATPNNSKSGIRTRRRFCENMYSLTPGRALAAHRQGRVRGDEDDCSPSARALTDAERVAAGDAGRPQRLLCRAGSWAAVCRNWRG